MLALPIFEDLLLFVPNSLFLVGFFENDKAFFSCTPATATCKEKLLIALHNSLLIVLLDLLKQNILVLEEEWVGRLLDFPTIGVVERKFDVPDLEILLPAPSARLS
jgi:hypothetical protein